MTGRFLVKNTGDYHEMHGYFSSENVENSIEIHIFSTLISVNGHYK